jgi:hypothetical protein
LIYYLILKAAITKIEGLAGKKTYISTDGVDMQPLVMVSVLCQAR